MSGHTHGPWKAVSASLETAIVYAGGEPICWIDIHPLVDEDSQAQLEAIKDANARLIAASPDMLTELRACEAHLQVFVEAIEMGGGAASKSAERLAAVRAVIAKATEVAT